MRLLPLLFLFTLFIGPGFLARATAPPAETDAPRNADYCLEGSQLAMYNTEAQQKLERIKRYFEDAVLKPPLTRRDSAKQRRICRLSPDRACIDYPGVFFTDDLEVRERTVTLRDYLSHLSREADSLAGLTNTCWTISTTPEFTWNNTTQRVGHVLQGAPEYAECTQNNPPSENYCVFKATGYLREEITLFKDNQVERVVKYRQINFELRYLEIKGSDCEYDWVVMIRDIRTISKRRAKEFLPKKEKCPIPEGRCDSTLVYETVPLQSYLVPGIGWREFNPKRKLHPWPLITAVTVGGLAYGTYHKFRSDKFYNLHLADTELRKQDDNYQLANENNHRFIVGIGVAALAWGGSNLWIYLKDRHRKKLFETRFGCDAIDGSGVSYRPPPLELGPALLPGATAGLGVQLTWRFDR